jgi:hypothetical protein
LSPRELGTTAAKALAGFLLGLLLWRSATPFYDSGLAMAAEPILRAMERPSVTRLDARGREIVVDREDFPVSSPRPGIPVDDLTFNVILLAALFAANRRPLRAENLLGFGLGCVGLFAGQVLGLVAAVRSLYAFDLGPWSAAHYGAMARNFWATAAHFYRLIGSYALAFLLWWLIRGLFGETPGERQRSQGGTLKSDAKAHP